MQICAMLLQVVFARWAGDELRSEVCAQDRNKRLLLPICALSSIKVTRSSPTCLEPFHGAFSWEMHGSSHRDIHRASRVVMLWHPDPWLKLHNEEWDIIVVFSAF